MRRALGPKRRPREAARGPRAHLVSLGGPFSEVSSAAIKKRAEKMLAALGTRPLEVSLALVDDARMKALHAAWMGSAKTTDVLAFPLHDDPWAAPAGAVLGDVVICVPQAKRQAKRAGRPLMDEVTTLLGHAILHLVGFDHRTKDEQREMDAYTRVLEAAAVNKAPLGAKLIGALLVVLAAACGSASANGAPPPAPAASGGAPSAETSAPRRAATLPPRSPPAGYVELTVGDVVATPHGGPAVLLIDESQSVVLPIFIGGTEAMSIDLRHNKKRYTRPLTHDLLDSIMDKLGGRLMKIQIDDVRDDTFVGAVYVEHEGQVFEIDARPSDAIALALGHRVPIYVSRDVMKKAGIGRDALKPPAEGAPPPPPEPTGKHREL